MKLKLCNTLIRPFEERNFGYEGLIKTVFDDIALRFEAQLNSSIAIGYARSDEKPTFPRLQELIGVPVHIYFTCELIGIDENAVKEAISDGDFSNTKFEPIWTFIHCADTVVPQCLLAANISNPGGIDYSEGAISVGDIPFTSTSSVRNNLKDDLTYARELGWPEAPQVTYIEAASWVQAILDDCIATSNSRVTRALAAFSRISGTEGVYRDNRLSLFWAMMGLEALYCEGTDGLKKQLFDKAAVLFGELKDNKRRIRKLYDFRSKFIHGNADIPFSFADEYESDDLKYFEKEIEEATSIAFNLLICTLQYLAKNNLSELNFGYTLIDKEPKNNAT